MEQIFVTLIYAAIAISGITIPGYVIFNSDYMKSKAKKISVEAKSKAGPIGIVAKARDAIENSEKNLAQINLEIAELEKKGVTKDQMGHLMMEKQFLEIANGQFGKMFGETIIDIGVQVAKKAGLNLK